MTLSRGALFFLLFACASARADIIPDDRKIDWSHCGVLGGIPDSSAMTVFTNIPAGSSRSYVQTALERCPSNQVVLMADGAYNWNENLNWSGVGQGVVWKGAGISNTIITISSGFSGWWMNFQTSLSSSAFDTDSNLTFTAAKGATNLIFQNGIPNWVALNDLICIDETNETAIAGESILLPPPTFTGAVGQREVDFNGINRLNGQRSLGQLVRVIATNATNITIEIPCYKDWRTNYEAQISQPGYNPSSAEPRRRCGIEAMTMAMNFFESALETGFIAGYTLDSCWFKDLELKNMCSGQGWRLRQAYRSEWRRVYVHGSFNQGPGRGYAIDHYNGSSANLTVDSIFDDLHLAQTYRYATMGNVFAYNFQHDGFNDAAQTASFSHHGISTGMNLCEGSVLEPKPLGDRVHSASWTSTIFRNRILGIRTPAPGGSGDQTGVSLEVSNRYWNVVGNIIGVPGQHNKLVEHQGNSGHGSGGQIYIVGGDVNINSDFDPFSQFAYTNGSFVLIHHNADTVTTTNNGIVWNLPPGQNIQEFTIPDSYIYNSKPGWWPANWAFPQITPGVSSTSTNKDVIKWFNPATYRYYHGITNFPNGTGYPDNGVGVGNTVTTTNILAKPTRSMWWRWR